MSKWKIAIPVIVILLVAISLLTVTLAEGSAERGLYEIADESVCNNIGTNVGPGEGSLQFEINGGKTRVEAVAVLNKMPKEGDSLSANFCLDKRIGGIVQNIAAVHQNRAIVTILSMKGLLTVGVAVIP